MTAGLHATITDGKRRRTPCLIIGDGVPKVHHSDGMPVFNIIEHEDGIPIRCKNGRLRNLLAYPSHWPAHGEYTVNEWVYAKHEHLAWDALIPCFTGAAP